MGGHSFSHRNSEYACLLFGKFNFLICYGYGILVLFYVVFPFAETLANSYFSSSTHMFHMLYNLPSSLASQSKFLYVLNFSLKHVEAFF